MKKKYDHLFVEAGKNKKWINKKYFSTHDKSKKPFTIILPPPNITGKLHLGHAWNGFLQDTLIRYKKIQGFDVKWIPSTDHAGIATQAKVEQHLAKEKIFKEDIGRNKFIKKVFKWKNEYVKEIHKQWGYLGFALDYSNERFTLDAGLSEVVSKIFINLYNRKLIYRDTKPINWDPKLQTVISNIEVINKDVEQTMYYINYDLTNGKQVIIATVRPETIFSDVALAINPNNHKHKHLIGQFVINPLNNRVMPIVGHESIEIDKGTGIMKVSAHAELDYQIIKDNKLKVIECIDKFGKMNQYAQKLEGVNRFKARKRVVKILEKNNRIHKKNQVISSIKFSQRSNEIIEILEQPQWFLKMKKMSRLIINDMEKENVVFFPKRFNKELIQWMKKSHDWCISRQLWWGHRIPVWYKEKNIKVQEDSPGKGWEQDSDVLDTWFSSGLAPFSFLGWPEDNENIKRHYPSNVLVTAYDIIFFWIARMYFQSLDIMKKRPFKNVLIHGLIRDKNGIKMSKSLGNGVDPIKLINKYGSDALRQFLLNNSTPGQDIRFSEQKIKSSWNFNNKIWNVARYIIEVMPDKKVQISDADVWINNKLIDLENYIKEKIKKYEFHIIGSKINNFVVKNLSSWYIEISKLNPNRKFAIKILKKFLQLAHPFLPFITDHIYSLMGQEILESKLIVLKHMTPKKDMNQIIKITQALRTYRYDKHISNKLIINFCTNIDLLESEILMIEKLGIAKWEKNKDAVIPIGKNKIYVKLSKEAKLEEQFRINHKIDFLEKEIIRSQTILGNKNFIEKAPKQLIQNEKEKLKKYKIELSIIKK